MPSGQRHYCTFFNKYYLLQGCALYLSLKRNYPNIRIYVICLDQYTIDTLSSLDYPELILIPVEKLDNPELAAMREKINSWQIYGVIQPLVIRYVLDKYNIPCVTYLEADMYFFSSPEPIFLEAGSKNVTLIPHQYSEEHNTEKLSGIYCTQFNTFHNDDASREVLDYWKSESFKYDKSRPEYYPGQLSLDCWTSLFSNVREIKNIGAGVAPWNIDKYYLSPVVGKPVVDGVPVIFYHFHQFGWRADGKVSYCSYTLPGDAIDLIYQPYLKELVEIERNIKKIDPQFSYRKIVVSESKLKSFARQILPKSIIKLLKGP